MSRPQQPEIGRSGHTFVDPDHAEELQDVQEAPPVKGPTGAVPPGNTPGHHAAVDQDKPDLDAFAERYGTRQPPDDD
jgi:hypothetical protein